MRHSESISAIAKALAAAQAEYVTVPKNKTAKIKTKTGSDYSYNYADLADCLAMALPRLSKHGIAFSQPHVIFPDGLRVVTFLLHESGEWMASDGIAISEAGEPQQFGAESTYFRRYDGCSFIGVAPDEDTDAQGAGKRTPKAVTPGSVISLIAAAQAAVEGIAAIQPPQATGKLQPTQQATQRAAAPPAVAQGQPRPTKRIPPTPPEETPGLVAYIKEVRFIPKKGNVNARQVVWFESPLAGENQMHPWKCEYVTCWRESLFDVLHSSVGKECQLLISERDKKLHDSDEWPTHFIDIEDVVSVTDPTTGEYVEYSEGKPVIEGGKH